MSLPGYDAWKLASPPEYDAPGHLPFLRRAVRGHDSVRGLRMG
jgi:hypothetical protein